MKMISFAAACITGMEKISKRIVAFGYFAALATYFIGFAVLLGFEKFGGDYTTGMYWYGECCLLIKEIIGATVIPALLYENFCILTGIKKQKENY